MLSPSKINAVLGVVYILLRELVKISSSYAHLGKTELDLMLKPKNLDWNSNPYVRTSNAAKTQIET